MASAIATGSTAIIARAVGARHRSLANNVCGQSIVAALVAGLLMAAAFFAAAEPIIRMAQLTGPARDFAHIYARLIALSIPFSTLLFVANACLRGAGDTLTPALTMVVVDLANILLSFGLTFGWGGLPSLGFAGIAWGTVIAFVLGGLIQFAILLRGRGGIRLYRHRLRPRWLTLKRIFRIGIPSGIEGLITWPAQFTIVVIINRLDPSNLMAAAHINAIRIESVSFMGGFALATAAATLVGQSLGMKNPRLASHAAYLAFSLGGGLMTLCGLGFIFFGHYPAGWLSGDPRVAELTARCLFITGFIQPGFAASAVFGGALRGAGDTLAVMLLNLSSVLLLRFAGVLIVGLWLRRGLETIWIVLSIELFLRGLLTYARFAQGGWKHVKV